MPMKGRRQMKGRRYTTAKPRGDGCRDSLNCGEGAQREGYSVPRHKRITHWLYPALVTYVGVLEMVSVYVSSRGDAPNSSGVVRASTPLLQPVRELPQRCLRAKVGCGGWMHQFREAEGRVDGTRTGVPESLMPRDRDGRYSPSCKRNQSSIHERAPLAKDVHASLTLTWNDASAPTSLLQYETRRRPTYTRSTERRTGVSSYRKGGDGLDGRSGIAAREHNADVDTGLSSPTPPVPGSVPHICCTSITVGGEPHQTRCSALPPQVRRGWEGREGYGGSLSDSTVASGYSTEHGRVGVGVPQLQRPLILLRNSVSPSQDDWSELTMDKRSRTTMVPDVYRNTPPALALAFPAPCACAAHLASASLHHLPFLLRVRRVHLHSRPPTAPTLHLVSEYTIVAGYHLSYPGPAIRDEHGVLNPECGRGPDGSGGVGLQAAVGEGRRKTGWGEERWRRARPARRAGAEPRGQGSRWEEGVGEGVLCRVADAQCIFIRTSMAARGAVVEWVAKRVAVAALGRVPE
ncbi:hypothetical protein B0H11DRAFT_2207299 [Mycena galericulata]|nr:hypothetical protein B0H11DRAFT_2207299 [Mycena galericulata]